MCSLFRNFEWAEQKPSCACFLCLIQRRSSVFFVRKERSKNSSSVVEPITRCLPPSLFSTWCLSVFSFINNEKFEAQPRDISASSSSVDKGRSRSLAFRRVLSAGRIKTFGARLPHLTTRISQSLFVCGLQVRLQP